jgi:hypothetical protein
MPQLTWNEVKAGAIRFSRNWKDASSERADKQTFYNEFFEVFGIRRASVAIFESNVRNLRGNTNAIDLLWRGKLVVEHKSRGEDLSQAETQAFGYIEDLTREGRHEEVPRFVLVSDFGNFVLYDLDPEEQLNLPLFAGRPITRVEFTLAEFPQHIRSFAFMLGQTRVKFEVEDEANEKAYKRMCELHDALKAGGLSGHDLERMLVRILFCLFAEDTLIFQPEAFSQFIRTQTRDDGGDLGARLNELFDWLNKSAADQTLEDTEPFYGFRYVNGGLFNERLDYPRFNSEMRKALLFCCEFTWAKISPAVFGSLFQGVLDSKARRQQGAHYTSERDIMKVLRSLFLDDLRTEWEKLKTNASSRRRANQNEFHQRLRSLQFLDPACGCGNFLVLAYRELRALEIEVVRELASGSGGQQLLPIVNVDQFHGIEYSEWPVRIAEVALWLMDHQMNQQASEVFGQPMDRLPLRSSPHIVQRNALRVDWNTVLPRVQCSYVLGNPPFVGKKEQNAEQKADMALTWNDDEGTGVLDYVTAWYVKAGDYIQNTQIRVALVSTNSISQGEQVGVLWRGLRRRHTLYIHFAHRSFAWMSEARGKAHVHVVIIGFAAFDRADKVIFEYAHSKSEPLRVSAGRINPYLADAVDVLLFKRSKPLCEVSEISYGSMANDQKRGDEGLGNLILDADSRQRLIAETPELESFIRRYVGSKEFINNIDRWCLWLVDAPPQLLRRNAELTRRINSVRQWRESSGRQETVRLASFPSLFGENRQPNSDYLLLPKVSSEERPYLPIGYLPPEVIASGSSLIIPGATSYEFGVLASAMHMAWMRYTGGRMKSDYQYSSQIVYNNFPWPSPTSAQRARVEERARAIIAARERHLPPRGLSTLADLYDPNTMPPELHRAHTELDRAVEKCYRSDTFQSDRARVEYLFSLYETLSAPLLPVSPRTRSKRSETARVVTRPSRQRTPGLPDQTAP